MKKHKQIDLHLRRNLEEKLKPSKEKPKERKQWFRLKDKFERGLVRVQEIKRGLKETLKKW
jgi:hypothetical protein